MIVAMSKRVAKPNLVTFQEETEEKIEEENKDPVKLPLTTMESNFVVEKTK